MGNLFSSAVPSRNLTVPPDFRLLFSVFRCIKKLPHEGKWTLAMFCASVAYPIQKDAPFDFDYFAKRHVPMFAHFLGENCVRFEVHKSLASPGAPAPRFMCTAYFWVKSGEDFGAALARHGNAIYSDIASFTTLEPVRQWNEVVE